MSSASDQDLIAGLHSLVAKHLSSRTSHAADHLGHHFTPRFDLEEHEDSYELFGDLPGLDKANITVEVYDDRNIQISGWIPRKHSDAITVDGTVHDPFLTVQHRDLQPEPEQHQGMERFGEVLNPHRQAISSTSASAAAPAASHSAATTASDAPAPAASSTTTETTTTGSGSGTAAKPAPSVPAHTTATHHHVPTARFGDVLDPHAAFVHRPKDAKPRVKYLVAERQYGHFHRAFHFPRPIRKDDVQARLDDGVLHISAPRAEVPPPVKIEIQDKKAQAAKAE